MKKLTSKQADLTMLIVALIWGSGFVVTKNSLDTLSAMQIMFYRFLTAGIISSVFFRKRLKGMNKRDMVSGSIMGFFLATGFVFQTVGLIYTSAANNAFLTSTSVVMVPFVYWITIRMKPKTNNIIAAFMMLIGIFLLTFDFEHFGDFSKGDFLTILGAVFFAFHIVSTGKFVENKDPIVLSTVQIVFSTAYFGVILLFDKSSMPVSMANIGGSVYLGVMSTFVCFALQTTAQKFTSASHAAIILSLESVFGSILAILFLKEGYNCIMLIGFVVIFMSVLIAEVGDKYIGIKKVV
ncbi:Permease of the drug/metabolite transporter (DMT) superfamily [Dethiosulfatibacter aminovorans DSM 17477]|uniref:Permease of the drug/metabolite transporter (DMT) superfamily n=1 Tax=Dethiosulfatibacter aminovorans DSM 17477 TaxID=1121476 RepID=A0A1M6J6L3_9FIRM|nr:DMT family transporter [Dethiosulfatibacter aminovorans]SHJ42326.1 Permease of the drug/metabolite transporter (DMT) superfamily [Dethiosulfatibacter aminovorans DSM 17477]